jgi:uncharacterized protein (TIGR03437 family)
MGVHGNGNSLAAAPANPGETITVYATGCGATSPLLVPSQMAVQALTLGTAPQATIGGVPATVVSGSVLPGTGGIYQISVQVPTSSMSGEQLMTLQSGAFTSAPVLVPVGK